MFLPVVKETLETILGIEATLFVALAQETFADITGRRKPRNVSGDRFGVTSASLSARDLPGEERSDNFVRLRGLSQDEGLTAFNKTCSDGATRHRASEMEVARNTRIT